MNEEQPRVPAGSPDGGQWTGREQVVADYGKFVEMKYPGGAPAAAEVIRRHWDTQAEQAVLDERKRGQIFIPPTSLTSPGTAASHVRNLLMRKPQAAADFRALKK